MSCGGSASLFVAIYYNPFPHLFIDGASGTQAAVALLPYIEFYVASVLLCGALMSRTGYHVIWFLMSGLFLTARAAAMYTITKRTANSNLIGADLIQFINISQGSSQLIGLAIASAIFQSQSFDGIHRLLGPDYGSDGIQAAIAGARSGILFSL
ncbi:hypothetical protein CIB48_g7714 [Xylaria polymorpha]|nr:hypothetical protein CIB48_g7714 [Xylaria polymorpha]